MNQLTTEYYFPSPVYLIEKPDFLSVVTNVSEEALTKTRSERVLDEIYPVYMTGNYFEDERLSGFAEFIGGSAWSILNEQGYDMQNFEVRFSEMWTQEHYKHSFMEQHVHSNSHIVGFYFLETPENCSRVVFHDTRIGKIMSDLPQKDQSQATLASQMINFEPKPGLLMFAPSWLPHSFTRHGSDQPIKFVHFNLYAQFAPQKCACPAEVI